MGNGPKDPIAVLNKVINDIENLDRALYSQNKKPKSEALLSRHPVLSRALEKAIED
jgi:hypothetical protein